MACIGCANRARWLFKKMGLTQSRVGPNHRPHWIYETDDATVLIPTFSAKHKTTRSTLLMLFARLLYGRSRSLEGPIPVEVWRLNEISAEGLRAYYRRGTMLQTRGTETCVELRRGSWLRSVGPIEETLVSDETVMAKAGVQ